jgi:hypothetical protein
MLGMQTSGWAVLIVAAVPSVATPQPRWGVFGGIEATHLTADDSVLGVGSGWTAGVEFRLTEQTTLDVELACASHVDEYDDFYVTPRGRPLRSPRPVGEYHDVPHGPDRPRVRSPPGSAGRLGWRRGDGLRQHRPVYPAPGSQLTSGLPCRGSKRRCHRLYDGRRRRRRHPVHEPIRLRPYVGLRLSGAENEATPKYTARAGTRMVVRW